MNVDLSNVSICGFSVGAAQAIQYHFSYSSRIKKVGIFAGCKA